MIYNAGKKALRGQTGQGNVQTLGFLAHSKPAGSNRKSRSHPTQGDVHASRKAMYLWPKMRFNRQFAHCFLLTDNMLHTYTEEKYQQSSAIAGIVPMIRASSWG